MDNLIQGLNKALTDRAQQKQWIETFTTTHLPDIVAEEVHRLMVPRNIEDISRVQIIRDRLFREGVTGIWDQIQENLIKTVRVQGGKLIPIEAIETAKTMSMDMQMLDLSFAVDVIKLREDADKKGASPEALSDLDKIILDAARDVVEKKYEYTPRIDHHAKLMRLLAPFQSPSTHVFFKSIQAKNYNQALRRVCTVNSEIATRMLSVLLGFKDVLSINVNEQAGPQEQTALHHLAKQQNQRGYDMLVAAGADESLKDSLGKIAKAYWLVDTVGETVANDEEAVASTLMRM